MISGSCQRARYRPDRYTGKVQQHIKDTIIHSVQKISKQKPDIAIGSSGTIMNLAEIAQKALHQNGNSAENISWLQGFTQSH
jgi:exopolyphosphatase/pppGpp-phosphohydrolase